MLLTIIRVVPASNHFELSWSYSPQTLPYEYRFCLRAHQLILEDLLELGRTTMKQGHMSPKRIVMLTLEASMCVDAIMSHVKPSTTSANR